MTRHLSRREFVRSAAGGATLTGAILMMGARPASAQLADKELRGGFIGRINEIREANKTELAELRLEHIAEMKAIAAELDANNKERVKLHHISTKYTLVEKHRRQMDLMLRRKLLQRKAAFLKQYYGKKTAGLTRRSQLVCGRLSSQGNELAGKLQKKEPVTAADVAAAIEKATASVPCTKCGGDGSVDCAKCKGTGTITVKTTCPDCRGDREVPGRSAVDAGDRIRRGGAGRRMQCPRCKGEGTCTVDQPCMNCFGEGKIECSTCFGTGTMFEKPQ